MYHRILVALDGSATAEKGLQQAIALAAVHRATLHLLRVFEVFPLIVELVSVVSVDELRQNMVKAGRELLEKAKEAATLVGVPSQMVLLETFQGRAAPLIVEEAVNAHCDLIVMGTHGCRGVNHLMLGSDAELVARTSPVPVLLVPHKEP